VNKRRAVAILNWLFWGGLLYMGMTVYSNGIRQGVPGYPNTGQQRFYILFPLAMVLLGGFAVIFATKLPRSSFVFLSLVQLALIPLYLVFFTGGM
jgi:hypothetical protein